MRRMALLEGPFAQPSLMLTIFRCTRVHPADGDRHRWKGAEDFEASGESGTRSRI